MLYLCNVKLRDKQNIKLIKKLNTMEKEIKHKIKQSVTKNTKGIKIFVNNCIENNIQDIVVSYKAEVEDMVEKYGDAYEELITDTYVNLYSILGSDIAIRKLMKCHVCIGTKELRFERY